MRAIEKKGFIKILSGSSRGIVLKDYSPDEIPVIGLVAAGGPILAQENIEKTLPNTGNFLSSNIDYFLRVKGDSMVEVGIFEDDLIGGKQTIQPKIGSIVVARINDEVTVKTLAELSKNKVTLRPENKRLSNIELDPTKDEIIFEGSCVSLVRESI